MLNMHELSGYKAKEYIFRGPEERARFEAGTSRPSGRVVLWDILDLAKAQGATLPKTLKPRSVFSSRDVSGADDEISERRSDGRLFTRYST